MINSYFAHGSHDAATQTVQAATDNGDGLSITVYILVGVALIGLIFLLRRINK